MKILSKIIFSIGLLAFSQIGMAQDRANKDQAVAMVAKGIAALKADGTKAYVSHPG